MLVKYCASMLTACLFQPYGGDGKWRLTTDSDHAGSADAQNKRHLLLAHMAMRGRALVDWCIKASRAAVQTFKLAWPEGDDRWTTAELPAAHMRGRCQPSIRSRATCTPMYPASATVKIYAGSVGLSQGLWLSYISRSSESASSFPTPMCIGADNATAVAYANDRYG